MEIMIALVAAVLLAVFSVFLIWKNYRLQRDIYDFTEKLDAALLAMLREEELAAEPGEADDLWGKVYERLARLSVCICTRMWKLRRRRRS